MSIKQDLLGKKFGKLLVIGTADYVKNTKVKWTCQCDCGKIVIIAAEYLKNGDTKSCGCLKQVPVPARIEKMRIASTKFTPVVAAARYIWRGHYKELEFDQFFTLSQENCHYCNSKPYNKHTLAVYKNRSADAVKNGIFIYNGLDRIDSKKSHTIDNVVPCCFVCNRAKRELCIKDFEIYIKRLINHLRIDFNKYRELSKLVSLDDLYHPKKYAFKSSANKVYRSIYNDGNLSLDVFYQLSQMNCYYCGAEPQNKMNACNRSSSNFAIKNGNFIYNGLDRIDNTKKHDYDNVIPCCKHCNYAKQKMTMEEFYIWIDRLKTAKSR